MKRALLFLIACCIVTIAMATNPGKSGIYKAVQRPMGAGLNLINELPSLNVSTIVPARINEPMDVLKISFHSSANNYGVFDYDQRYLTIQPGANMFTFGNRGGGVFGNTLNDLKFKYTVNQGTTWDSAVFSSATGKLCRYPSMVTYNPGTTTNPHDMFGVFTGPITDGTNWIDQYSGSIKLDGTNADIVYTPNGTNVYLNHMNISLYCSPDGHATVASSLLLGNSTLYYQHGFCILNGTFNSGTNKFDWAPFDSLRPLLKESGRTDAADIAWSPDGSVGYFVFTAIDSNLTYNPYGVEWPVIYKSTDHGVTWVKAPAFDFSNISMLHGMLFPTLADTSKVIPRWFNKWADVRNEGQNGLVVDKFGNLHIFGYVTGTMSINPDSINYFYSANPTQLFDVYMNNFGGWNAIYVDTLASDDAAAGTYGMGWDHMLQMSRTPDGSKVFCVWTDTDPGFASDNSAPDIKGLGFDVVNNNITTVKNFTEGTDYWGLNYWMRIATDVFYDGTSHTSTLPVTTSTLSALDTDPLVHQYVSGMTMLDSDFGIFVGTPANGNGTTASAVSANYPNPFSGNTQFSVNLAETSSISMVISTVVGQQVSSINYGTMSQGVHSLTINAGNLSSGVYFYTVVINDKSYTHKMIVK